MPRGDGTGPMGGGPMTGGGFGICTGARGTNYGFGFGMGMGCRQGFRRNRGFYPFMSNISPRENLAEQKRFLEDRLNSISKELEKLSEDKE